MKFNKFRISRLCGGYVLAVSLAASIAFAASVESSNKVWVAEQDGQYVTQAYFDPQHKVLAGEGYGLTEGKRVKQAYVRAKADGKKTIFGIQICGSADTERLYSREAKTWETNIIETPTARVTKCWTCTQRTYYGWVYF